MKIKIFESNNKKELKVNCIFNVADDLSKYYMVIESSAGSGKRYSVVSICENKFEIFEHFNSLKEIEKHFSILDIFCDPEISINL